jgi:hypothetical protein
MTGSNPTDRGKLGTKRHKLTYKNGIPFPLSTTAIVHDIKAVVYVTYNAVINRTHRLAAFNKRKKETTAATPMP